MNNRKSEFTDIVRIYGESCMSLPFRVNGIAHCNEELSWGLPLRPRFTSNEEAAKFADMVDRWMAEYKADIIAEYKEENDKTESSIT